jgi:hypothetical protein
MKVEIPPPSADMLREWFEKGQQAPVMHFYWRDVFDRMQSEEEFISSAHPDWSAWVAFIEAQFCYPTVNEKVFVALSLAVNRVELPEDYRQSLSQGIFKYLANGSELERAFFGYKRKLPYNTRFRRHEKYRLYFQEMILAQKVFSDGNAKKTLRGIISERDSDFFDTIYRDFLYWKKSEECSLFLKPWLERKEQGDKAVSKK